MSATGREDGDGQEVFRLMPEDCQEEIVKERLEARKQLNFQVLEDAPKLVPQLAEEAWNLGKGPARVLIYCDRRIEAVKVKDKIDKKFKKEKRKHVSELLVGGRRVREREELYNWLEKYGFFGKVEGAPEQPTFLIATSAGEVGVDLDAEHMVCDLVAWERMVQRLGRVNRRGKGNAHIEVITAPREKRPKAQKKAEEWKKNWEKQLYRLRKPFDSFHSVGVDDIKQGGQFHLSFTDDEGSSDNEIKENSLPTSGCEELRDASPGAILDLRARSEQDQDLKDAISSATTPVPLRPALTRALVDAWSLTSLEEHTGRPDDIQPWLRGWEEDSQPQTTVLWRKHLPVLIDGTKAVPKDIEAFFEAAPPHASEKLETETSKLIEWLIKHSKRVFGNQSGDSFDRNQVVAYVLSPARDLRHTIQGSELVRISKTGKEATNAKNNLKEILYGATLVVAARFGGLSEDGMLDEKADQLPRVIDDGQDWLPKLADGSPAIRFRVRSVMTEEIPKSDKNWRERHRFEVEKTDEGDVTRWLFVEKWRHDASTEEDRSAGPPQELEEHQAWAECKARALASALELPGAHGDMLSVAARLHDEGKRHEGWQRAFNAPRNGKVYAKTKGPINVRRLDGYRHEFGSLPCVENDEKFKFLPPRLQELALHLIAAHHGWARPIISTRGSDSPNSVLEERACDVALRFAQVQKQWGPWGLAWWESLLRAADQQASRDNDIGRDA